MRITSLGHSVKLAPPPTVAAGIARHRQMLSAAGLLLGLAGAACVAVHFYALALPAFLISRVAFVLTSPEIATERSQPRDILCDAFGPIALASMPFAFALALPGSTLAAGFLLFALVSWVAASRSTASRDAVRFLPSAVGSAAVIAACAAPAWFGVAAYLAGMISFVSVGMVIAGAIASKES